MLRVLIGTGVLLMAVGFGAAGWQYWQTMPKTAAASEATTDVVTTAPVAASPTARQGWLISPTGGLVPQGDVRPFLAPEPVRALLPQEEEAPLHACEVAADLHQNGFQEFLKVRLPIQSLDGLIHVLQFETAGLCLLQLCLSNCHLLRAVQEGQEEKMPGGVQ